MDAREARRVVLALMAAETFREVAAVTADVAAGNPVMEDYGFSPAEVARARADRLAIAERYTALKQKHSFTASEVRAKAEFLENLPP